jgi:hypothetical protein
MPRLCVKVDRAVEDSISMTFAVPSHILVARNAHATTDPKNSR